MFSSKSRNNGMCRMSYYGHMENWYINIYLDPKRPVPVLYVCILSSLTSEVGFAQRDLQQNRKLALMYW